MTGSILVISRPLAVRLASGSPVCCVVRVLVWGFSLPCARIAQTRQTQIFGMTTMLIMPHGARSQEARRKWIRRCTEDAGRGEEGKQRERESQRMATSLCLHVTSAKVLSSLWDRVSIIQHSRAISRNFAKFKVPITFGAIVVAERVRFFCV